MRIRKLTKEDAREVSKLKRGTLMNVNSKDYNKKQIKVLVDKNSLEDIIKKLSERATFCLEDKGTILGVIDLEDNKIGGLFIKHNLVGKGYGKKLLVFIENYAKKKNIKKTKLWSTKTAYNFYLKNGYKLIKKGNWIPKKGIKFETFEMEKRLK